MKRLVICQSSNKQCKIQITTEKSKGQIISCSGCKRKFVEDTS